MLPKISVFLRRSASSGTLLAPDSRTVVGLAPAFVVASIAVWVLASAAANSGQWGDHFEQFAWAHSVEWGYHKHPPLPTWMLAAAIAAFGPSVHWATALAACCFIGTALFTYAVARELLGKESAALACLLLSLVHGFSARASLFNHNTVMLLMVSATAFCVLRGLRPGSHFLAWGLAGIAAALAVLSKYQAVVPLAGIVLAAGRAGDLAARPARHGLALAAILAAALLVPHATWLSGHTAALEYATQQGRSLSAAERAWNVTSFLAQQLRYLIGPLLLFGLLAVLPGPRPLAGRAPVPRRERAWLAGLVAFPLCVTVLTGPLFGIALQNHWGYQALQFASLWLAWRLRPLAAVATGRWFVTALAVHGVLLAFALADVDLSLGKAKPRIDGRYPAQALADAVNADWKDDTLCPLRIVAGPTFEAGIVSVYGGGTAAVLEDGSHAKTPWVTPADLARYGAVWVAAEAAQLPTHGVTTVNWMEVAAAGARGPAKRVYWAIAPPESCEAP